MTRRLAWLLLCIGAPALRVVAAHAQPPAPAPHKEPQPPPDKPDTPAEPPGGVVKVDELPPGQRLGYRAALLREQVPVIPVVVVVPDARSFVEAVARWKPGARFPVLIEDGSGQGLEDIARFVRAFRPRHVVRWTYTPAQGPAWPPDPGVRRTLVEQALARAWDAPPDSTRAEMIAAWKKMGIVPPGLVVANMEDPAWPAALTLAAGHAEPVAWITVKQGVGGELTPEEGQALAGAVEGAAETTGLSWKGLGDDLDAVTLCLNCPAKIAIVPGVPLVIARGAPAKPGDVCATTDRVGRPSSGEPGARWAWASQVFGSERQSAYRAMCALFMEPRRAWLFDGYKNQAPWSNWDCTAAAENLKKVGLETILDDTPHQGRSDWRSRAAQPLDAGLVFVNTQGMCNQFLLEPANPPCRPGDIPLLNRPAIVHMVHSWSLQYPQVRETVGGRWLDYGAYAYFGSVEEPFLGAFLPTPNVAARLAVNYAWGAACRAENQPLWRLACIGDPLVTVAPTLKRLEEAAPPLEGATDLRERLAVELKAADGAADGTDHFGQVVRLLVMLGEDEKAALLAGALARERPEAFTLDVGAASMYALARTGRIELLGAAFAKLDEPTARDPYLRDALWLGSMGAILKPDSIGPDGLRTLVEQLQRAIRPEQAARDAEDLAPAYARAQGRPAAARMLEDVKATLKDQKEQADLDKLISAMR